MNFAGNRELAILPVAENCVVKVNLGDIKGENLIPQPRSELSVVLSCRRSDARMFNPVD